MAMNRATGLPRVLSPGGGNSALSMERALKQVLGLLELQYTNIDDVDESTVDRIRTSIDDVEVMLLCIGKGEVTDV